MKYFGFIEVKSKHALPLLSSSVQYNISWTHLAKLKASSTSWALLITWISWKNKMSLLVLWKGNIRKHVCMKASVRSVLRYDWCSERWAACPSCCRHSWLCSNPTTSRLASTQSPAVVFIASSVATDDKRVGVRTFSLLGVWTELRVFVPLLVLVSRCNLGTKEFRPTHVRPVVITYVGGV